MPWSFARVALKVSFGSFMCGLPVARGAAGGPLPLIIVSFTSIGPCTDCGTGAVVHREHLAAWPHVLLRVAVAIEAPLHLKRAPAA